MSDAAAVSNPLFDILGAASPRLVDYTQQRVVGELWGRPGLAPRDRAIATVSILIARQEVAALPHYFNKALDHQVSPAELSELLTHLAFYAGWPSGMAAAMVLQQVFAERGIDRAALPAAGLASPPDSKVAGLSAEALLGQAGQASPALLHFTRELLLGDLWCRPALQPRDRALASFTGLAALGQTEQLAVYLQLARTHGVSTEEVGEVCAHIAFYAGWGLAIQAANIAADVG